MPTASPRSLVLAPLALALAALPLHAQGSRTHEDTDYGFRLKLPRGWSQMPMQIGERWQVAKYLCDRAYFWTDPAGGWTFEHHPELVVIAFPLKRLEREAEVEIEEEEGKGKVILIDNPYVDYLDYLRRTHSDGGFYVSDESEGDLGGVAVTRYEIKVEKLARTGPKRIAAWVFHAEDVDFAVQVEVLENSWSKLQRDVHGTLRSFRLIPRTTGGLPTGATAGSAVLLEDMEALSPEERGKRLRELEKIAHFKARESAPEGWEVFEAGRFLVLNHTDSKYARRVAEQAEAVFQWLDGAFPFVGPEEYVRRPILRICKDWEEMRSFYDGGTRIFFGSRPPEIVSCQDHSGQLGWSVEAVNRQVVQVWFQERDRDLWFAMPSWITRGLYQLLGTARLKRGKLEFKPDDWERDGVRRLIREGRAAAPRELMRMVDGDFQGGDFSGWIGRDQQAGSLVRFLATGPASKSSRSRDVLTLYLKNLGAVVGEREAEREAAAPEAKPVTEEEEEQRFRQQNEQWRARESELLEEVFDRTFRSWSARDWDDFEELYFKSVG